MSNEYYLAPDEERDAWINDYDSGMPPDEGSPENPVAVNVARSTAIPADADESLCEWLNERQAARDAEEREWFENERARAKTADNPLER